VRCLHITRLLPPPIEQNLGTNAWTYILTVVFSLFWIYFLWKEIQRAYHSFSLFIYFKSVRNIYVVRAQPRAQTITRRPPAPSPTSPWRS